MKTLLALKEKFKSVAGVEWKAGMAPPDVANGAVGGSELEGKITAQGNVVRQLKSDKADKVYKLYML